MADHGRNEPTRWEMWIADHATVGAPITAVVFGVGGAWLAGDDVPIWFSIVKGIVFAVVGASNWVFARRRVARWRGGLR